MEKIKVIVADDNTIINNMIAKYLKKYEDIEILGQAYSDDEEIQLIEKTNPEIVITDLVRNNSIFGNSHLNGNSNIPGNNYSHENNNISGYENNNLSIHEDNNVYGNNNLSGLEIIKKYKNNGSKIKFLVITGCNCKMLDKTIVDGLIVKPFLDEINLIQQLRKIKQKINQQNNSQN